MHIAHIKRFQINWVGPSPTPSFGQNPKEQQFLSIIDDVNAQDCLRGALVISLILVFENNVCLGSVLIILFIDYVLRNDTNFIKHSAMERIVP